MNRSPIALVPESRRAILDQLKKAGSATIPQLAQALSISTEGVRQQIWQLEKEGWVISDCGPDDSDEPLRGRPAAAYCLSRSGDDLFPKAYAQLATDVFDSLRDPVEALAALTDDRVRALAQPAAASLPQRIEALRSIYAPGDPYTTIEKSEHGYQLVERNCPYLRFALDRPLFCSTTVSTLRRLTGCEVVRETRFQDGDGACDSSGSRRRARRSDALPPA